MNVPIGSLPHKRGQIVGLGGIAGGAGHGEDPEGEEDQHHEGEHEKHREDHRRGRRLPRRVPRVPRLRHCGCWFEEDREDKGFVKWI